jgi:hypothetical protein
MSLIDKNEDQVLRLVEDGSLLWGWNVALDPKRGHNKELRILPAAVADYMQGRTCALQWPDVFGLLLPDDPTITSLYIYRILNMSGDHLYNLVRRKQLIPCSTWGRGPRGKARFAPKRFIEFLQKRRYP